MTDTAVDPVARALVAPKPVELLEHQGVAGLERLKPCREPRAGVVVP